ncbi:MAG: substrate-binding domain-containing protein [Chloroflexota bacterium]|nr:substrate-binding domain-containing protein [Chloroflexota bacterium]
MTQPTRSAFSRRDFLRISGAGAFTLAVAACGAPAQPSAPAAGGEAAAPAAETVLLRIQVNPDEESPVFELFKQNHPNVEAEFISVTGIDHEEVAAKMLAMLAAGEQMDLGFAATEATQLYAGKGLALALDDYVKANESDMKEYFADVHPSLNEAMMWEGSLYQLSRDFNAANMYYNTAAFEQAGFGHPDSGWTKEEFYEIAKAIASQSGSQKVYGYAWINRLWGSWMPWIFVNGGNLLTEERAPGGEWLWETFYADDPAAEGRGGGWRWLAPQANNSANVEALDFMVQLFNEGITPAVELGGGETLQGFFTSGTLAMTPAGGFWSGGLANAGMANGAFDVQLFPNWKNQRHQFGTGALFIFAASKNLDTAWEYYKFGATREAMEANGIFNPVTITTPSRRSMCNAERFANTGPEHWEVFYATLDDHPDTAPIPAPPISNPMTTLFTAYTARAMSLEMTPQQAMDGLQKELEDLYSREGAGMYKLE